MIRADFTVPECNTRVDGHVDVYDEPRSFGWRTSEPDNLIARGELPCIRLGRRILVPLRPLMRLLEGAGASPR